MRRGVILASFLALFAGFTAETPHAQGVGTPASAQAVPQQPSESTPVIRETRATFRAATEIVVLNVTVTDKNGRYVDGLSKNDFVVLEEGVPQDVSFFGTSNVPIDLALMIDTSASMTDKIEFVHQAATRLVRTLRPSDRGEIVGFSEEAHVLAGFTSDKPRLEAAIAATKPRGDTALYNSVYIALQDLQRQARKEDGVRRPAIVVLTDGDDNRSLVNAEDLLDAARRSNVAVYTISIASKNDPQRFGAGKRFMAEADFTLKTLAQDSGARSFFPMEVEDLDGVYQQIAEELGSQYSLAYAPAAHGDDRFHRLCVRIPAREGARPRTRAGYYASRRTQAALTGRR